MKRVFFSIAVVGGLIFAPAQAQTVVLDCAGSDMCFVDVDGISFDTIAWSFDKKRTDARFPANCTNSYSCSFYCPTQPGTLEATVRLVRNQQIVASSTSPALCTAEPL